MNIKVIAAVALSAICLGATANQGAMQSKGLTTEQTKRITISASRVLEGTPIEKLTPTGHAGLVEILTPSGIFYTDQKGSFVIFGATIVDTAKEENLTSKAWEGYGTFKFNELPLNDAVKVVRGDGKRVLVTLEDPNCGFCRKLMTELQKVDNVTIYTFLVPILSKDSHEKVRNIWCAPDRAQAWLNYMGPGTAPAPAPASCQNPIERNLALYKKLRANGTPAMLFTDNKRISGFVAADRIEAKLASLVAAAK
jgi:thiol:disulfide interchange protein DsbC